VKKSEEKRVKNNTKSSLMLSSWIKKEGNTMIKDSFKQKKDDVQSSSTQNCGKDKYLNDNVDNFEVEIMNDIEIVSKIINSGILIKNNIQNIDYNNKPIISQEIENNELILIIMILVVGQL